MNTDGNQLAPVTVTTYYGPPDICSMTPAVFRAEILNPTRQSGAATLVEPDFRHVNATIDTAIDESNRNEVLRISFPTTAEDIKITSCPGWAHRPHQVFDDIKQVTTDAMGNVTQSKVQPYGEWILYACKALGHRRWDICVSTHFYIAMRHL